MFIRNEKPISASKVSVHELGLPLHIVTGFLEPASLHKLNQLLGAISLKIQGKPNDHAGDMKAYYDKLDLAKGRIMPKEVAVAIESAILKHPSTPKNWIKVMKAEFQISEDFGTEGTSEGENGGESFFTKMRNWRLPWHTLDAETP